MSASTLQVREEQRCRNLMLFSHSVFVFGSNLLGIHGKGAARDAADFYGAKRGVGVGRTGRCYAIPTKKHWRGDARVVVAMPLTSIARYVREFVEYAEHHPELVFAVTRIGCGLAGYTDEQIAPLFVDAPERCDLPEGWREIMLAASRGSAE